MTCVSEQGRTGLLWTVFEGEPFSSKRIASFAEAEDAREYIGLMKLRKKKALVLYFETEAEVEKFMHDHDGWAKAPWIDGASASTAPLYEESNLSQSACLSAS